MTVRLNRFSRVSGLMLMKWPDEQASLRLAQSAVAEPLLQDLRRVEHLHLSAGGIEYAL